ncbi:ClpXP adapter SpxH family protein [Chitinophaga sp. Hz27]|uniref:ClpXP adapter SpxH family protein n=1 Tax=Chitinophaga sp. Hz27 TaxID=3347169 RepID=UPI0035E2CCA7
MSNNTIKPNPLLCDPATGVCEMPAFNNEEVVVTNVPPYTKPLKVVYFTDPICSSCWGIEPELRKLKLEYGSSLAFEYRMGGLLPDWSYNSGGISKPADVAHHWDEVSAHYDMPIDGDVWLEDPLDSSYPPSIAFKAAQLQDNTKAIAFLRAIREMVFLEKKNITKWEHLAKAAEKVQLDVVQLKADYEGQAKMLFEEDLKIARTYGVRGFPSLFFENNKGEREFVYGVRPYATYETAILKLHPDAIKTAYSKDWETLFSHYPSLTAKEFTTLSGLSKSEAVQLLNDLAIQGSLENIVTKNGDIWRL